MINDIRVSNVRTWKYVDDTTVAEIVPRGLQGDIQGAVDIVEGWSHMQSVQLNATKCKELIIDFKRNKHTFSPVVVVGNELSTVDSARILGVIISKDRNWNNHENQAIKKANKRLYFLVLLKRAGVRQSDIANFYCTAIRPVLEYCSPVFHHSPPEYLGEDLE